MIELIGLLLPAQLELLNVVAKTGFKIHEDVGLCESSLIVFGWTDANKNVGFCPENVRKYAKEKNYPASYIKYSMNIAVVHESVHVAQMCNNRKPVLTSPVKMSELSKTHIRRVINSMIVTRNLASAALEAEAYYLEKSPTLTAFLVKKYCL
jgi:hypothetical protein